MDKASNGQEAFNMIRANKTCDASVHYPYELVILDNMMPLLSGIEVAERVREYQANGDISSATKLVLATGDTRCQMPIFDRIFVKPIKAADFREFIEGLKL